MAWAAYTIGLGWLGGATFADSPLLGAAFGTVLCIVLAGIYAIVEKRRAAPQPVPVEATERGTVTAGQG